MPFLLGGQRKGPVAQPGQDGQGERFGVRFEPARGSTRPKPEGFPGRSGGRQLCPRWVQPRRRLRAARPDITPN